VVRKGGVEMGGACGKASKVSESQRRSRFLSPVTAWPCWDSESPGHLVHIWRCKLKVLDLQKEQQDVWIMGYMAVAHA
jgi:hypothetical protein